MSIWLPTARQLSPQRHSSANIDNDRTSLREETINWRNARSAVTSTNKNAQPALFWHPSFIKRCSRATANSAGHPANFLDLWLANGWATITSRCFQTVCVDYEIHLHNPHPSPGLFLLYAEILLYGWLMSATIGVALRSSGQLGTLWRSLCSDLYASRLLCPAV